MPASLMLRRIFRRKLFQKNLLLDWCVHHTNKAFCKTIVYLATWCVTELELELIWLKAFCRYVLSAY